MAKTVPATRPYSSPAGISFGAPVRAFDWTALGALANYVKGRGCVLIPRTFLNQFITAGPSTGTFRFRVKPTSVARRRLWLLELQSATAGVVTTGSVSINGGASIAFTAAHAAAMVVPSEFIEDVSSPAATEAEINVAVTSSATGAVIVVAIACIELPMAELAYAADGGTDFGRVAPIAPVDVSSLGIVGAAATAGAGAGALNLARRVGMHHFAKPTEGGGLTTTSTSFVPIYTAACEPQQLGRYLYNGDTTRALTFKAYGSVTGGATFSVRVTMTSGATTTITTTSATPGWFGTSNTIAVDAEDLTVADGRRSARWDLAVIDYKVSSGVQTGSLWSVSIWEDNAP